MTRVLDQYEREQLDHIARQGMALRTALRVASGLQRRSWIGWVDRLRGLSRACRESDQDQLEPLLRILGENSPHENGSSLPYQRTLLAEATNAVIAFLRTIRASYTFGPRVADAPTFAQLLRYALLLADAVPLPLATAQVARIADSSLQTAHQWTAWLADTNLLAEIREDPDELQLDVRACRTFLSLASQTGYGIATPLNLSWVETVDCPEDALAPLYGILIRRVAVGAALSDTASVATNREHIRALLATDLVRGTPDDFEPTLRGLCVLAARKGDLAAALRRQLDAVVARLSEPVTGPDASHRGKQEMRAKDLAGRLGLSIERITLLADFLAQTPFLASVRFSDSGPHLAQALSLFHQDQTQLSIDELLSRQISAQSNGEPTSGKFRQSRRVSRSSVFLLRGRNRGLGADIGISVRSFLDRVELNVIDLEELPNGGRTMLEKLDEHLNVDYAIAILAADSTENPSRKAQRQASRDVLLDLGIVLGRLRRDHLCIITEEGVLLPERVRGLAQIIYSREAGLDSIRLALINELKAAQLNFNINNTI